MERGGRFPQKIPAVIADRKRGNAACESLHLKWGWARLSSSKHRFEQAAGPCRHLPGMPTPRPPSRLIGAGIIWYARRGRSDAALAVVAAVISTPHAEIQKMMEEDRQRAEQFHKEARENAEAAIRRMQENRSGFRPDFPSQRPPGPPRDFP